MADVKELVPEFFYLPEMFLNSNAFDLGVKQNGVRLDDVVLPKWAHGDVHEFIRLHRYYGTLTQPTNPSPHHHIANYREALECDYVSEHLHEWIDLIFGYRQNGEPAKEAYNVFHHLFYEQNVNFDNIDDPLTRNATLGFINNFGQIPAQLFKKPHPQKKVPTTSTTQPHQSLLAVTPGVSTPRLFYHCLERLRPSSQKPVKERRTAVGDIVSNERGQVIVLEQQKILLQPTTQYLTWGFHDRSIRLGQVGDKVGSVCLLETNSCYEVTCMACTADGKVVFTGMQEGLE